MGTCALSNLPILEGEKVKILFLLPKTVPIHVSGMSSVCNVTDFLNPFVLPLSGIYDGCSLVEDIICDWNFGVVENTIKDYLGLKINGDYFKEVSGKDIVKYYNCSEYRDSKGSLGNSCMKNVDSYFFDIYCDNENCNLLVLFDKKSFVIGRALVWKNVKNTRTNEVLTLMDRVYTSNSNDEELFFQYAKENGYYRKYLQTFGNDGFISPEGIHKSLILETNIKNLSEDSYAPYLDTFMFLHTNLNKLCTNNNLYSDYITLNSTSGDSIQSYFSSSSLSTVYSSYYDEDIVEGDSVYSDYLNSYIREENSVLMRYYDTRGSIQESYMPDEYDNLVYLDKKCDYWHRNDVCQCTECGNYYLQSDLDENNLCPSCVRVLQENEIQEENKEEAIEEKEILIGCVPHIVKDMDVVEYSVMTQEQFEYIINGLTQRRANCITNF
jgi:hypothetical protein